MLKPEKAKRIAKKIASKLTEIKDVKAVGIYGSFAKGYADKFTNDVDLVVFCERIPEKEKRDDKLKELDAKILRNDVFLYEEVEITIFYKTIEDANRWIKSFRNWEGFGNDIAVFIENMIPVSDAGGIIGKLKKDSTYTDKLRKKIFEQRFYALSRAKFLLENPLKRNNAIFISQKLNESFAAYCNLLYSLNKKYFSDTKWINRDLENFRLKPKNCFERLEEFSLLGCGKRGIRRKMEILKSLAEETGALAETLGIDASRGMKELERW